MHPSHIIRDQKNSKRSLLRVAAIYGANASGKSNIVNGIREAQRLVLNGIRPDRKLNNRPFRLDANALNGPTKFDFVINYKGSIYNYGFLYGMDSVEEEWLFRTGKVKEVKCFERITKNNKEVVIEIGSGLGKKADSDFLRFIAKGTRPNQLFLHEMYEKNVDDIKPLMEWFKDVLIIVGPSSSYTNLVFDVHEEEGFPEFLGDLLKAADTGIDSVVTEPLNIDMNDIEGDLERHLKGVPKKIISELLGILDKGERITLRGSSGTHYAIDRNKKGDITVYILKTQHKSLDGKIVPFDMSDESDGTNRLIHLAPMLMHSQKKERVFVVDEIDRSMHPILTRTLVDMYLRNEKCIKGQLICTTHETYVLDLDLLRRDEVWFVEKDDGGSSHISSLIDYKIRPDLKVDKGYLNGRFGAIPFVGDINLLLCEGEVQGDK
jgi:AAA15 family ATPase/GTPase